MTRARHSLPIIFFGLLVGTWATAANGQCTTNITSPATGSTVTFQGSQQQFSVEFKLDSAWTYYG